MGQLPDLLAAVDLGSNSFRMMIGKVQGASVSPVLVFKEPIRLGAGLDDQYCVTDVVQAKVLDCLGRFAETLATIPPNAVRVVATHAFRQAQNMHTLLPKAEAILGFPINIISGEEEARLIFKGVKHSLPRRTERRLVIDIGGGSTECMVGDQQQKLQYSCSLNMGCLSWSLRFFPHNQWKEEAFNRAELVAQNILESVKHNLVRVGWDVAYASSGTVRAVMDMMEVNGWGRDVITLSVLKRLKQHLLNAGSLDCLQLPNLLKERAQVLAGGLSLMIAIQRTFAVNQVNPTEGALQLGVLYDIFSNTRMRRYTLRSGVQSEIFSY